MSGSLIGCDYDYVFWIMIMYCSILSELIARKARINAVCQENWNSDYGW